LMHFKNPDLLYALFLIIIPILVHLFQWRKFKIEYFTNVKLLQKLSIQTRKSSKLKKYLLLFTRCFIFITLIIAFAQPFFKAKDIDNAQNQLYVAIDNSHSMQAIGKEGELMLSAINQLILETPEDYKLSILTNENAYWNTDIKTIKTQLLDTKYSATSF
ncbi:MAG: BatA domain-containing protein, partial [Flavobacterium sp.]